MQTMTPEVNYSDAQFSECQTYRYMLRRWWGRGGGCLFIMLNPSTATAEEDDPTIRRCIRYAMDWGYAGLRVVNLFAFRATDPKELAKADAPVGPLNNRWIVRAVLEAEIAVAAWGTHGTLHGRDKALLDMLHGPGFEMHCLGRTKEGHPKHPLYLRKDAQPVPFNF